MSKLNFSNITEAYNIPSEVIKETSEEISKLKKIVENSAFNGKTETPPDTYKRIGNPDKVSATFCENKEKVNYDDFEYTFLKLSRSPQFDDIVKNYILLKHPDWLLSSTSYLPNTKETFGKDSSNICNSIQNYILFFVVSLVIYLILSFILKK